MAASAVPARLSEGGAGSSLTPVKRTTFADSPIRSRDSPAYSSRRHSLYGIDDRIVIDPGSRIWTVGFSGETDPRAVFWAKDERDKDDQEIWDLDMDRIGGCRGDRKEGGKVVAVRIVKKMREVFSKHLLTDSKARKILIIENTFFPMAVKEYIARALFESLKTPSVSFTPSSLLSLAACGRITGLVVDCGWLETTVTPVYYSRPLYPYARSTSLAGRSLHARVSTLIQENGQYFPSSSNSAAASPIRPPKTVLTDALIERIITEACFVGDIMPEKVSNEMEIDDGPNDSEETRLAHRLQTRYQSCSTATELSLPLPSAKRRESGGSLIIPGWIRERAAEVLFEQDPIGEAHDIPRLILGVLRNLPIDIRRPLISSILVVGGTASLPGFIPRISSTLRQHLNRALEGNIDAETSRQTLKIWKGSGSEPFAVLHELRDKVAILNDPSPLAVEGGGPASGSTPRWKPSLMSWVGGSLAGALKTSAPPMLIEDYDTLLAHSHARGKAYRDQLEADEAELAALEGVDIDQLRPGEARFNVDQDGRPAERRRGFRTAVINDWTRDALVVE